MDLSIRHIFKRIKQTFDVSVLKRILVTDGPNKNTLAVIRTLGAAKRYKIDITTTCSPLVTLSAYSKYVDRVYRVPISPENIVSYGKYLLELCRRNQYDHLIPVGLKSCLAVSKFKKQFQQVTKVAISSWNAMSIAYDKSKTMEFAKNIDIPIPRTIPIYDASDLKQLDFFPVVIKSSDDSRNYVKYCNTPEELYRNYQELADRSRTLIIGQEYVRGFGCGFFAVCRNGQVIRYFMHKRLKEFPITGGPSAVAESFFDKRLLEYGRRICTALSWDGAIMVEFKYDAIYDDYKLVEINPKLWGSLDLTISAGVNIPELLIDLDEHEISSHNQGYSFIRYRWVFPDELKVVLSKISIHSFKEFLSFQPNTRTNLNLSDLLPTLIQVIRGIVDGISLITDRKRQLPHGLVQ